MACNRNDPHDGFALRVATQTVLTGNEATESLAGRLRQKHGSWLLRSSPLLVVLGIIDCQRRRSSKRLACERSRARNIRACRRNRTDDARERRRDRQCRVHHRRQRRCGDRHRRQRSRGTATARGRSAPAPTSRSDTSSTRMAIPIMSSATPPSCRMEPSLLAIRTCRERWPRAGSSISMRFAESWVTI